MPKKDRSTAEPGRVRGTLPQDSRSGRARQMPASSQYTRQVMEITGSSDNARSGIRLRPLAQRQLRIPPWLVLRALGILPHHEPVEEHVRWEPLLESGTSR